MAGIAAGSHIYVELAIRTEADVAPTVLDVLRQLFYPDRLRGAVQAGLDAIEAYDAIDLGHIETSILIGYTIGIVQPLRQNECFSCIGMIVQVPVRNGIEGRVLGESRFSKDSALCRQRGFHWGLGPEI